MQDRTYCPFGHDTLDCARPEDREPTRATAPLKMLFPACALLRGEPSDELQRRLGDLLPVVVDHHPVSPVR